MNDQLEKILLSPILPIVLGLIGMTITKCLFNAYW